MKKSETVQKLVLFGAMTVGALLVAEGYLRVRTFVDRVNTVDRQIVALKQEVNFLRVQFDVVPRPGVVAAPPLAATVQPQPQPLQPFALPIPEPMRISPAPQERPKNERAKDAAVSPSEKGAITSEAEPDDGKIVLLKDAKETKAAPAPLTGSQPAAAPTVDVKLWPKK